MKHDFIPFLIRAKQATYAGEGPHSASSRPQSHDLHYQEDDYLYIDTYLGGINFLGEEAVWHKGTPIWGMNYSGYMLSPEIPAGFSEFLKAALMRVPADAPYRGPSTFRQKGFEYRCRGEGTPENFYGKEAVHLNGQAIYELRFHGGIIG